MDKLKKNYTDKLTANILDVLPPMRVIIFKTGKECIGDWLENKNVSGNFSHCSKAGHYMFYYKDK